AIALSGISGRLLVARKKDVRAVKGDKTLLLRDDYTGKVEAVNLPLLTQFIGPGRVPVVAPLALSTENEALNVDGDRVAAAIEDAHTSGLYTKRSLVITRGEGATVWDSEGRAYVDCVGGQGSANLGHGNTAVAAALADQARTLASCTELFYNDRRAELYEVLAGILPRSLERVFLCNSGTEAVEGALKFAR